MAKQYIHRGEIIAQVLVIITFIGVGYSEYSRHIYFVEGVKSIGDVISTNYHLVLWYLVLNIPLILFWLFIIYHVFENKDQKPFIKLFHGLGYAVIWILAHLGIFRIVYLIVDSTESEPGQVLRWYVNLDPTDSIYTLYLVLCVMAFAFWSTLQFIYNYEELSRAQKLDSELALIRSQIRPHFYFNTLNNLYSMAIEQDNAILAEGIQNLNQLMRYSLEQGNNERVPLSEEWEYIRSYVELQKLRFEENDVQVELSASGNLEQTTIGPMILINFVENAFKHGISLKQESNIKITLERRTDSIYFSVINSNHPSRQDTGRSGIGSKKTTRLLDLLYEDTYSLKTEVVKGMHIAELIIQEPKA